LGGLKEGFFRVKYHEFTDLEVNTEPRYPKINGMAREIINLYIFLILFTSLFEFSPGDEKMQILELCRIKLSQNQTPI
jgi:hypothetical protein